MLKPLVYGFCFYLFSLTHAQNIEIPGADELYQGQEVLRMDVTIAQEYLDQILEPGNESSDVEYPADFKITSSLIDADEPTIGFRLRGNTSRFSAKKSFKVSFNTFEKGRDLKGYEKLNLNGEHNDPSIIRSKLCWDLMQAVKVPAPRAGYAALYINQEYKGLYINVEHIDEEFVELRFDNKDGNLYKCLYPADLNYRGDNPDAYKFESGGRRTYELTINKDEDDYSDLANFIFVLNETSDELFYQKLEEVFETKSYLKTLAIEMLTGHWDNYGLNKNNFYLYHNPSDDKFYYIPFDLDNTLGVDFFQGVDRTETDVYEWYDPFANRPLTQRMMENSLYRSQFSLFLEQILNDFYQPELLFPEIDRIKAMINTFAKNDDYKGYDWGFSDQDFDLSYTEAIPYFFIKEGLKPYIQKRYDNAWEQLVLVGVHQPVSVVNIYPNPFTKELQLTIPESHYQVNIANTSGQYVYQSQFQGTDWSWPGVSNSGQKLPEGMYYLQLIDHSGISQLHKILIDR